MNSETTTTLSQRDAYKLMLKEYPDVMDIVQMCQILDVSTKTGYRLIREGKICCIKVGRAYRIPKAHLFTYLCIGCLLHGEINPIGGILSASVRMIYTVLRSTAGVAHNKRGGYLIMVAGHLREKKGYFYAVLNYTDAHGNRKTKWIATGLAVKGNKKRAEAFLQEQRRSFQEDVPITGDVLFADFMEQWLTVIKSSVAVTTFASYSNMVKKVIVPYFRERQIALQELSAKHIQDRYTF